MYSNNFRFSWACLVFASAGAAVGAGERLDLERETPVPASEPVPIMDFFRPRLLQSPALNPAGTHMAALVSQGKDKTELLVSNLDKKAVQIIGGAADKDIYSFAWLDDQWLVYHLGKEKLYGLGLMAARADRLLAAYPLLQYTGARLVGVPQDAPLLPLVWMSSDTFLDGRDAGVAVVRVERNAGPMINLFAAGVTHDDFVAVRERNDEHVAKWHPAPTGGMVSSYMPDRQGRLAFATTFKDGYTTLHRLVGEKWEKSPIDLEQVDWVSAGDEPGKVLVAQRDPGQPLALRVADAATGEAGEVLVQDKAYDFSGWVVRDRRTRKIVGAYYDRAIPTQVWFDESYRNAQKILDGAFPRQVVRIVDNDIAGRFLLMTFSDRQPAIYHRADLANRSVGLIKNSAPWIDPERMRPMSLIQFKTRDGHKLDAYVTLPAGASKQNPVPLIVLPHGGPWVRDTWGFDGEVQFLASRGYAVLQPNYRGSTGYDWGFTREQLFDFRKMHDDVTDAVKTLVTSGVVAPDRMAIMGTSFGAYLALSGAVHEPSLYRCAVTLSGVFDWERVLKDSKYDEYTSARYAFLRRWLGDPKTEKERYESISPLRYVENIRIPIFVAHGREDSVANVGESKRLVAELKRNKVAHEVLLVGGEGHGMAHLKNQVELYGRIEAFLAKNLAPKAAAGAQP